MAPTSPTNMSLPPPLRDLWARMKDLSAVTCPESPGFVPADGDPGARICLIGEAPAEYEVREGRPFAGPAGRVLDDALIRAGMHRPSLWLTNVVKCRTMRVTNGRKENRAPLAGETKAWLPLLREELAIVKPEAIICLGATAAKAILGKTVRLTDQRGEWFDGPDGARVLMTFHPAYVLHLQPHDAEKAETALQTLIRDLRLVRDAVPDTLKGKSDV